MRAADLLLKMTGIVEADKDELALLCEKDGILPLPREFDCRLCDAHVYVDKRSDRRTVFCCERCEREYWRHYDRYQRDKNIAHGHVVQGWELERVIE